MSDESQTRINDDAPTRAGGDETRLSGDDRTRLAPSARPRRDRPVLTSGSTFGAYRIERLLGRGGMGEVYEAEHLEHGRRLALKTLHHDLATEDDHARFLSEGQLAASITHANTVYVFGSEEINGTPVITMELLSGGTLKDRVDREGALEPGAAVDAVLQIAAGLEAAHEKGILHRDIKPSNCFVDADGTIKVGDFGLSISTGAHRRIEGSGSFMGTPQYAAPEQLRGEALDVRADIYALGATLYYLLTGRAPFDDGDLTTLVTKVTSEPARPPRLVRPAVSRGLSRVVLRMLAKKPGDRPADYATLMKLLRPYASAAMTPAGLGLRFVAGVLDQLIQITVSLPFSMATVMNMGPDGTLTVAMNRAGARDQSVWWGVADVALMLIYYALLEGIGDASIGKRLCGLRVVDTAGRRLGVGRAALRAAIFMTPQFLTSLPSVLLGRERFAELFRAHPGLGLSYTFLLFTIGALLFVTMRRGNGFAAIHDLVTRARVVGRERREVRPVFTATAPLASEAAAETCGPYRVVARLGAGEAGVWASGFDPVLKRPVSLHLPAPGTPPLPAARRNVSRPGRLRWLGGRRRDGEAWDAFAALDGAPFAAAIAQPQSWHVVRHWLADVSLELKAAEEDGTRPSALALDRVWISASGQAVLLDDRAPQSAAPKSTPRVDFGSRGDRLVAAMATQALAGDSSDAAQSALARPLPLSARRALEHVVASPSMMPAQLAAAFAPLATGSDRVTRWRRAIPLLLTATPGLFATVVLAVTVPMMTQLSRPEFQMMAGVLAQLQRIERGQIVAAPGEREALEIYVSATFGDNIGRDEFWRADGRPFAQLRPLLERARTHQPSVTADDLARAKVVLRPLLADREKKMVHPFQIATAVMLVVFTAFAVVGLAIAVVMRTPLLKAAGIEVVRADGRRASRLRLFWRTLMFWSPLGGVWLLIGVKRLLGTPVGTSIGSAPPVAVAIVALAVMLAWALRRPERGPHDRLAGTWLVMR